MFYSGYVIFKDRKTNKKIGGTYEQTDQERTLGLSPEVGSDPFFFLQYHLTPLFLLHFFLLFFSLILLKKKNQPFARSP